MVKDKWRFYDVTHADLEIMNPMSSAHLDQMLARMRLLPGSRAVDFGCGKGELLARLAERNGARGVGVDASPYSVRDARRRARRMPPTLRPRFVLGDGAAFQATVRRPFDAAFCVGATWIFGGWEGTLRALCDITRPGGSLAVGHPFWRHRVSWSYLRVIGEARHAFSTRERNLAAAQALGLALAGRFTSTRSEWHHYESSQWRAATAFARTHPRDPLAAEFLARTARERRAYQTEGRDGIGWTLWVFRKKS